MKRTRLSICNRKVRFATGAEALAAATRATIVLHPYRCDRCRRFHLTSRTKGKRVPRPFSVGSTFSSIRVKEGGPRIKSGVTSQEAP